MKFKKGLRMDPFLFGIALLSAFLNTYNIWKNTYANAYYTAAVTSMLQSFHNFFFASFDPGGFVTVDKPPLTFWIQTLFAWVFGIHGWSVILPQALAGVGSVLMIYILVKPTFGKTAARLASLIIACTPIAVAVSRTNNIDSMLVFTLLVATWMLFRAIRRQKAAWAVGAFAMIGVGFNMKMLEAYMVVPAFFLLYWLAFQATRKKKMLVLTVATAVMVVVSLSWALIVDAVPAEQRPYIGSSQTNSVLELALGYNGVSRLTGMNRRGDRSFDMAPPASFPYNGNNMMGQFPSQQDGRGMSGWPSMQGDRSMHRPAAGHQDGRQGPGGGGAFGTGQPGPLRLFQSALSGQSSWLLPFVAFASDALLAGIRRKKPLSLKQQESFFWLGWLLPAMAFFSVAGFFHPYYLIMLAPPIAALAGAGWVEMWRQYRTQDGWKKWLLPASLLLTTAFELYVLYPYRQTIGLIWLIGIGVMGFALSLLLILTAIRRKFSFPTALAGLLVLLVAPLYWSATPLLYGDNSTMPQAGPERQAFAPGQNGGDRMGMGMGRDMNEGINTKLLAYLSKNSTGEKYLFATTDAHTAAPYIIETGKAVMAMGGFSGSDPILTVERLKQMVANKEVKYFLIPARSGFGGGNNDVLAWIRAHGKEVPAAQWQESSMANGAFGMRENMTLYQVKS